MVLSVILPKGVAQIFPKDTIFEVVDSDAWCYLGSDLADPIFMYKGVQISVICYDRSMQIYVFKCIPSKAAYAMGIENVDKVPLYLPALHLEGQLQTKLLKRIGVDKQCVSKKIDNDNRKLCRVCGGPVSTQIWFSNRFHGVCLQCEPLKGK